MHAIAGLPALHAEREALRQGVLQLRGEHAQLQGAVAAARDDLMRIQQEVAAAREQVGTLQESVRQLEDAMTAGQALEAVLLDLDAGDRIFTNVARIAEIRQKHPGRLVALEHIAAESVRKQIREFLVRTSAMPSQPPSTMSGATDTSANG